MSQTQVLEKISRELFEKRRDMRYPMDAYLFVISGLEFYCTMLGERRHVTGQELSVGLLTFAHKQFGLLARSVLRHWGINATDDLGNIVYNLISIQVLSKQPEDRIEDFHAVVDLDEFCVSQKSFEIDPNFIKSVKGA